MGVLLLLFSLLTSLVIFSLKVSSEGRLEVRTSQSPLSLNTCQQFSAYTPTALSGRNSCLGQYYEFGHQIQKSWEICSVEPDNQQFTYADSVWTFYKCVILASLDNRPLTLESYSELMAGNLSAKTRSEILSLLVLENLGHKSSQSTTSIQQLGNVEDSDLKQSTNNVSVPEPELRHIKKYWDKYFNAEFRVCTNYPSSTCDNAELLDKYKNSWKPERKCQTENLPYNIHRFSTSWPKFSKCRKLLHDKHHSTNKSVAALIKTSVHKWCGSIADGIEMLEHEDVERPIDFEPIYNTYIVPKFYSKSVQQHVLQVLQKDFSGWFFNYRESISGLGSVSDICSYAGKHLEEELVKDGHSKENVMFLANANILKSLLISREYAFSQLCRS